MAKAAIHYFSATGNTRRGVDLIAERLRGAGWEVELFGIERARPAPRGDRPLPELTVLAFPVLAWAPPVFVRRYIRRMPRGRGARAAVFATWGAGPEGGLGIAARALARRGYDVAPTGGAAYPSSWAQMESCADAESAAPLVREGDAMSLAFADTLVSGGRARYRRPPLDLAWSRVAALSFDLFGRRVFGKLFVADESCTACGLCARVCPAGAISMAARPGGSRPRWSFSCESCNRCINACPNGSLQSSGFRLLFHGAILVLSVIAAFLGAGAAARAVGAAGAGPFARTASYIAAFAAASAAALFLQFGPLDSLAFALEDSGRRRLRGTGYSKSFLRRLAPGFAPEAERPATGQPL